MSTQGRIVPRDEKMAESQSQWTYPMYRASDLAFQDTSDCKSTIAVRIWVTTLWMSCSARIISSHCEWRPFVCRKEPEAWIPRCCKVATTKTDGANMDRASYSPAMSKEFVRLLTKVAHKRNRYVLPLLVIRYSLLSRRSKWQGTCCFSP